jgi:peptidoglycan/xylan/chitin deacetylase (PgdA/CDA1 family)
MSPTTIQLAVGTGAAISAALGLASYATFVPGNPIWGPLIWHGARDGPAQVALTFDDGPTAGSTDKVLDQLAELNVKAAFFVIGRNVEREPDLLRRIAAEGHLIGNHTYDHSRWASMGRGKYWQEQVARADVAIERVLGRRVRFFRPPIGHKTPYTMAAARENGHVVVNWSVRAWDGVPTTAERIVKHVLPRCRAGSIVVLHDGIPPGSSRDPSPTLAAIKPLILGLRQRGLEPVRLDELVGLRELA